MTSTDWTRQNTSPPDTSWGEQVPHSRGPTWLEVLAPSTARPRQRLVAAPRVEVEMPNAAHCTIVAVDIEGFGEYSRNNTNQLRTRRGLYGAMRYSFETAGIPWEGCRREDRGDGVLILAPADIPKALFADRLPDALGDALSRHNRSHPTPERIRLRLALHAGEIHYDEHGVTSSAITHTFRLLDAPSVKSAFAAAPGVLAVVSSGWFFEEVVRHSDWSRADAYEPVDVVNKETVTMAWVRLLGDRRGSRRLFSR